MLAQCDGTDFAEFSGADEVCDGEELVQRWHSDGAVMMIQRRSSDGKVILVRRWCAMVRVSPRRDHSALAYRSTPHGNARASRRAPCRPCQSCSSTCSDG